MFGVLLEIYSDLPHSDTNTTVPGLEPIPSSETADAVLTVAVRPEGVTT